MSPADAPPAPDACMCNAALLDHRIGFNSFATTFYGGNGNSTACYSDDGEFSVVGELLGGGAALEDGPNEFRAWFTDLGPYWGAIIPRDGEPQLPYISWGGFWEATAYDADHRIISTVACLLPAEQGAACQRELWTSYEFETAFVAPERVHDLQVSCSEGILVGGGCIAESPYAHRYMRVLRAGFAPDDRDAWLCSWANHDVTEQYEVMAVSFCLHEESLPAECGCCPSVADSIVVKRKEEPLRSRENRIEVSCDEGQLLMQGNCMLDIEDISTMSDVTMFRDGFPPTPEHPDGDRSVWGCSWFNPTGMTPRAIATAVCLPAN